MLNMRSIIALFEESGNSLRPWAEAGFACYAFDIQNDGRVERFASGGSITFYRFDLDNEDRAIPFILSLKPGLILSYPPCDDMAASGAKHFYSKLLRDPDCQTRGAKRAQLAWALSIWAGCGYFVENPVSVLATIWRKPDFYFDPFNYGGYLPIDDVHPRWPNYIAPRDAYPKKTCGWIGGGFIIPPRISVSVSPGYSAQFKKLGGKSKKTKQIRSEGPRGFLRAVFMANVNYVRNMPV